jgi:ATP-binding cassette subfamily B protein
MNDTDLDKRLREIGFTEVLSRFEHGLTTPVSQVGGASLSLGQKQLISFMRAILRKPKLLILDEATANIDTVTEAMLNQAIDALPKDTTKIIIAHRLNTIKEADEIMFVNGHHVTKAGSFEDAIKLIESSKRSS